MRAHRLPSFVRRPSRLVAGALAVALTAAHSLATWSIVLVDTKTGEVGIGQATCISNFDLQMGSAVVVVGKGAACAQSAIDTTGANRLKIFQGLQQGKKLGDILADLIAGDMGFQGRQYGIVSSGFGGDALTFTGTSDGQYANGITGQIGSIRYAIQGNVLAGAPVVIAAEQAILNTPGAMPEKLMAAMEAARSMGGDGRCSCSQLAPTSCGSPPPSFTKAAEVGYLVVARIGDVDGVCTNPTGCANGSYFMNLNVVAPHSAPDPVIVLQGLLTQFRQGWIGHADALESNATTPVVGLPADGTSVTTLTVRLVDWQGTPIGAGGASVSVTHDASSTANAAIGAVLDHGNGTYSVPLTAGAVKGVDVLHVVVDDGKGPVLLTPFPRLAIGATCAGFGSGTPGTGGAVPTLGCGAAPLLGDAEFGFHASNALANAPSFLFLASASANLPFGATGTLLVDPGALIFAGAPIAADGSGAAFLPAPIPSSPTLSGVKVWAQGLVLDAGAELGVSATAGVAVELL